MIRRPPRSTQSRSSAASDVYKRQGLNTPNVATKVDSFTLRGPLGVTAAITPFNFPVMVPMWIYPIALACGNTMVWKPSSHTPGASQLQAELWKEAGLPDGVFNVVFGLSLIHISEPTRLGMISCAVF